MNFKYLDLILAMDFSHLRANAGRATDAAIGFFVNNINLFSESIDQAPTGHETQTFHEKMSLILQKINVAEHKYFFNKYQTEGKPVAEADSLAQFHKLSGLDGLSKRMQYWAAVEGHGDPIRNPSEHKHAVEFLSRCFESSRFRHTLFRGVSSFQDIGPNADLELPSAGP